MSGLERVDSRVGVVDNTCSLLCNAMRQILISIFCLTTSTNIMHEAK